MMNFLIFVCASLLSVSVMAQSNDNAKLIKKVNDVQPVEFTVKSANTNALINTKLSTIKPAAKIENSEIKLKPATVVDREKLKLKSKAVEKE